MKGLTTTQVAERLQVGAEAVREYIRNKQLKAYKVGKQWIIKEEDLEKFIYKKSNMEE